eukprot:1772676-Amphidinium_carterae.1
MRVSELGAAYQSACVHLQPREEGVVQHQKCPKRCLLCSEQANPQQVEEAEGNEHCSATVR